MPAAANDNAPKRCYQPLTTGALETNSSSTVPRPPTRGRRSGTCTRTAAPAARRRRTLSSLHEVKTEPVAITLRWRTASRLQSEARRLAASHARPSGICTRTAPPAARRRRTPSSRPRRHRAGSRRCRGTSHPPARTLRERRGAEREATVRRERRTARATRGGNGAGPRLAVAVGSQGAIDPADLEIGL